MLSKFENFKKFITFKNIIAAVSIVLVVAISVTVCVILAKPEEPTDQPLPEIVPTIKESAESELIIPLIISAPSDNSATVTEPYYILKGYVPGA